MAKAKLKSEQSVWDGVKLLVSCDSYFGYADQMHVDSFAEFMYQCADLIANGTVSIINLAGYMVDLERSKAARHALENGFTHLFLYDADMTVSRADIEQLLSRKVDIVSGTYFMRGTHSRDGAFPCVASRGLRHITRTEIAEARDAGSLIETTSIGGGSLLISHKALYTIGIPHFQFEWRFTGSGYSQNGEDGYFSKRAIESGFTLYMDPLVMPDHFAHVRIGFDVRDRNGTYLYTPTIQEA